MRVKLQVDRRRDRVNDHELRPRLPDVLGELAQVRREGDPVLDALDEEHVQTVEVPTGRLEARAYGKGRLIGRRRLQLFQREVIG